MDELLFLRFAHLIGVVLMGGGLLGVFVCDIRSRQTKDLNLFGQAVSMITMFYDGLVVPGAIILFASGTWLIVEYHDGWEFFKTPWLAGMVILFAFEFIEGNTVTRLFFMRLKRLTHEAIAGDEWTPELVRARGEQLASFTHFLDLPMLLIIISLAVLRPESWTHFLVGSGLAIAVAMALNYWVPKLYPWDSDNIAGK
jgi:uncharacterized membrane protein